MGRRTHQTWRRRGPGGHPVGSQDQHRCPQQTQRSGPETRPVLGGQGPGGKVERALHRNVGVGVHAAQGGLRRGHPDGPGEAADEEEVLEEVVLCSIEILGPFRSSFSVYIV